MKNKIRLTESQLHRVIKESVRRILKEQAGELNIPGVGRWSLAQNGVQFVDLRDESTKFYNFTRQSWNYNPNLNKLDGKSMTNIINYLKSNGVSDDQIYQMGLGSDINKETVNAMLSQKPVYNQGYDLKNIISDSDKPLAQTLQGVGKLLKWDAENQQTSGLLLLYNNSNINNLVNAGVLNQEHLRNLRALYQNARDMRNISNNYHGLEPLRRG